MLFKINFPMSQIWTQKYCHGALDFRLTKPILKKHCNVWSKGPYVLKIHIYVPTDKLHKCLYIISVKMFHFNDT